MDIYKTLVEKMHIGFTHCKIIFENDRPIDFEYLEVNKAFYDIIGQTNIVGMKMSEIQPALLTLNPVILATFGRVALSGIAEVFETYLSKYEVWLNISVQCSDNNSVIALFENITERKQFEQKLQYQNAFLEAQLNTARDGILIVDNEGKKIIQNQRTVDLWKIPQEITDNNDEKIQLQHFMNVTRNPVQFVDTISYINSHPNKVMHDEVELTDGTIIERYSAPVVGKDGQCYGRFWNFSDVTHRKTVEQTLRKSEEKFSKAFKASPAAISIASMKDGKYLEVNDVFLNVTNYKRDEVIGHTSSDLNVWVNDHDREKYINELTTHGCLKNFEILFRMNSGEIRTFLVSSEIVELDGNRCSLNFIVDITERKLTEEALRESEEKYRILFNTMIQGVVYQNADGKITSANPAAERILGITIDQMQGLTSMDPRWKAIREDGSDFPGTEHPISLALRTGKEVKNVVHGIYHPIEDKNVWINVTAVPLFKSGETKPFQAYATIDDITERKQTEEIIGNIQKLESLGVLAGGIAHDFNNLMSGIFGYIDLAKEKCSDKVNSIYLSKAMSAIDRGRNLTKQLLTFAKGGAPIKEVGHLFPFVSEVSQFALSGSNVSCVFNIPESIWPCNYDKNQMSQVIDNIVINAQQAMPNGGAIEISAQNVTFEQKQHPTLLSGNYVKMSIKDYGIGISKKIIDRIFDPFYTTKTSGHGLGLATSFSVVKRHGGTIAVESDPGQGSTFHILLPASLPDGNTLSVLESTPSHSGNGSFLVMDDEEIIRDTVGTMLETLGYTVICKDNGKDAIEFFANDLLGKCDLVGMIFDLTIPGGMGGKEAIGEIRKLCAEIPVFVSSGYAEDPVMANPKEYGFTASICKPFRKSELAEMLRNYFKC